MPKEEKGQKPDGVPPEGMQKAKGSPLPADQDDLPIDRGYAWVIVFSCMFSNLVCLGLQRAYGILFVEFLVLFQMPVSVTALILAVQAGCTSVTALLTQTIVLSLLSERQTVMVGGLCGGLGIILSYFANSLYFLFITQSLLVGAANGLIMGPCMVLVNKYFHRRRAFATSLSTIGGNLGAMVFPLFAQALVASFGVRGSLLVLGASYLHVLVAASLMRPLEQFRRRRRKVTSPEDQQPLNAEGPSTHRGEGALQRQRTISAGSHSSGRHLRAGAPLCISTPDLFISSEVITDEDESDGEKHELQALTETDTSDTKNTDSVELDRSNGSHDHGPSQKDGNVQPTPAPPRKKKNYCSRFLAMMDFKLFKKPPFLLIIISYTLGVVPAGLFGNYLPAMAMDAGVTGQKAALLLTVFGAAGIGSRLLFGYIADKNFIRRSALMGLVTSVSCVAGLFTPLYTDFNSLLILSLAYGLFGVVYFSLMPVVVVDLMGLPSMSKTLGFVQLFQGASMAASHPLIGYLRDQTGTYHASYYFMSASGLLCSALLIFVPLITTKVKSATPQGHPKVAKV